MQPQNWKLHSNSVKFTKRFFTVKYVISVQIFVTCIHTCAFCLTEQNIGKRKTDSLI